MKIIENWIRGRELKSRKHKWEQVLVSIKITVLASKVQVTLMMINNRFLKIYLSTSKSSNMRAHVPKWKTWLKGSLKANSFKGS